MKKLIGIAVLLAILALTLLPAVSMGWTGDEDCGKYPRGGCCWEQCCAAKTYWYKVSYFERVWNSTVQMWGHRWVFQYVKAHDSKEAAKLLGLKAGYGCFVSRAIGYQG